MIISINGQKTFDQIQHQFMTKKKKKRKKRKTLSNLEIEEELELPQLDERYLQKPVLSLQWQKPIVNIILKSEKLIGK